MKTNYVAPLVEVVEIEIEDAILSTSSTYSVEDFTSGSSIGESF
ncbi:MAG: hypothetical protein SNH94_07835 [Rikenellaceae bacterium]